MSDTALILERDGPVAIITNNDAPMNRMSLEFIDALEEALPALLDDVGVRAVVIRGAGDDNFSVGMNLKQFGQGIEQKGSLDGLLDQRLRVEAMIENAEKPFIAVLCGYCLGGGLEIPLACHFRVAAAVGAQIGLPEMDIGTVPAWGGSARLTRCIGRPRALDMILRAKKISGPEALEIGLVQEVWPNAELQQQAIALAHELAKMPPWSVGGMIKAVNAAESASLDEALAVERQAVHDTSGTNHQMEGMMAFMEKREADFSSEPEKI